jgi:glutamine synthetase
MSKAAPVTATSAPARDRGYFVAEYIWVSGQDTFHDIRSKCKTMTVPFDSPLSAYPVWNFDGSSTGQNIGDDTEILIKPVALYDHPFLENAKVVLAECFYPDGTPTKCNSRNVAARIFDAYAALEPMYGLEQEYVITGKDGRPIGWPDGGYPGPQGPYYCGNGSHVAGREIAMEHYQTCLKMGLRISGTNAEVMPGQWEFQVGPCIGIEAGDHLVVARWVFQRIVEVRGLKINYECKPIQGDWNGSGCHTNFSTKEMRAPGGLAKILDAVQNKLPKTVLLDVPFYGQDNHRRLTGKHETSKLNEFTFGYGTRHTSIRIPNEVKKNGCGYYEDRRPASNIDPYLVTARVLISSNGLQESLDAGELVNVQSWMKRLQVAPQQPNVSASAAPKH